MSENSEPNSHQSIVKATSIFGFAQFLKIAIGIVSSKLLAIFLGASGIGFVGLLNNTLAIISSITGFGINVVAVRELSLETAQSSNDNFSKRYQIIQKWSLISGIIGCLLTIIFSKLLSRWTFGNENYYFWFILLSINFIINALTNSKSTLLQSKRMVKEIALTNVVTSFFVVLVTIPIYYFYRFQAIVPVIILSSIIGLLANIYFARKIKLLAGNGLNLSSLITEIKPLIKLGFLLSINVIFGQICNFLIRMYLKSIHSNLEILGFYEVGSVLLLSYVGMIFGAMSTDFYPRLTKIAFDNQKVKSLVNDQIEIGLLIISPLILVFYCLSPIIINILYSADFMPVIQILKFGLLAIIVKSIIWPLAYIILSKGENKLYFKQEIFSDLLNVSLTITFYYFFGLLGIGLAMLVNYVIYGIYVYWILNKKFEFNIRKNTLIIIYKSLLFGFAASMIILFVDFPIAYFPLTILSLISIIDAYKELDSRIDISKFLMKIKSKF